MVETYVPNRRVVVVDDDPSNLELLQEILLREGCEVRVTSQPKEAASLVGSFNPSLVLLDQDMPGLTGLDVLKLIKTAHPDIDVMFISAHSNPRMVSSALEQGADDYIRKPFSIVELTSRLHVRFRIRDLREQLRIANQKLADLAITDDLTGLFNMRQMYEKIEYELKRTKRSGKPIGCVMFDMDHFKSVNDAHDHLFGSFVLTEMGKILRQHLRETDFAARYGGDEFLVILTETDTQGTAVFCQRLLEIVRNHTFRDKEDHIQLTLSLGYSIADSDFSFQARDLVRVADHALYTSKEQGRNQVNGFGPKDSLNYLNTLVKKAS